MGDYILLRHRDISDIKELDMGINCDLPKDEATYIHRIGKSSWNRLWMEPDLRLTI